MTCPEAWRTATADFVSTRGLAEGIARSVTHRVICLGYVVGTGRVRELELPHQRSQDGTQLHVGELLTDATMAAGAEWKVRAVGALADQTVTVVNLFNLLILGIDLGRCVLVPAVGVPLQRVREEFLGSGCDTRGREDVVAGGNNVRSSLHRHGVLDGADNGVNWGVNTEGLLDHLGMQVQLLEALIGKRGEIGTQDSELLLVELLHDLRAGGQAQNDPGSGRG